MANQIWVEFLDTVHVTACLFKSHFKLSFSPLATNIQHWCHIQNNVFYSHWSRAWLACQHCCTSSTHLSLMLFGAVAEFCITMAPPQVHSKKEKKRSYMAKCPADLIRLSPVGDDAILHQILLSAIYVHSARPQWYSACVRIVNGKLVSLSSS